MKLLLAFLTVLALPVSAAAQDLPDGERMGSDLQTGSRFKMQAETPDAGKGREMQKRVARCVTYRSKTLVREILAKSDPSQIAYGELTIDAEDLSKELGVSKCISRAMSANTISMRMSYQFQTLRNLFAEEVYLMDVNDPLVIADNEPETLPNRYFVGGRANPMAEAMATMGDCFSYRGAVEGDAFLRTRPGTSEERDAVSAFMPVVDGCIGGADEMNVDVSMMRKIVADGLWSRYHSRTVAAGIDE